MSSASTSSNTPDSTVYVLDQFACNIDERGLLAAQQYAVTYTLPLAVIAVTDSLLNDELVQSLLEAESQLATRQIPLILLVGRRGNALKGLSAHLHPRMFMQDTTPSSEKLQAHTVAWPGHVEPVNAVIRMIQQHPDMCRF